MNSYLNFLDSEFLLYTDVLRFSNVGWYYHHQKILFFVPFDLQVSVIVKFPEG